MTKYDFNKIIEKSIDKKLDSLCRNGFFREEYKQGKKEDTCGMKDFYEEDVIIEAIELVGLIKQYRENHGRKSN